METTHYCGEWRRTVNGGGGGEKHRKSLGDSVVQRKNVQYMRGRYRDVLCACFEVRVATVYTLRSLSSSLQLPTRLHVNRTLQAKDDLNLCVIIVSLLLHFILNHVLNFLPF